MSEFERVLRPGGHSVVTTHGARYVDRLTRAERRKFDEGRLVVRRAALAGTNHCTAFHPETYVREELANGFELLELEPEGARGDPHQDLVLLRRRR
jgi:hypothetical protein